MTEELRRTNSQVVFHFHFRKSVMYGISLTLELLDFRTYHSSILHYTFILRPSQKLKSLININRNVKLRTNLLFYNN